VKGQPSAAIGLVVSVALVLGVVSPVVAQDQESGPEASRRVAFDFVVGWQDFYFEDTDWPVQFVFDAFTAAELAPGWQVSFRPKLWRNRGEWEMLVDQASIQYEFTKGSHWRIEAGRFPSPIGLGMMENRPTINPGVIWWHRPYYMPLPVQGSDVPLVSLISAVYPEGVEVMTSTDRWDARAAFVDRAPVDFWQTRPGVSRAANGIVGAGVTPWQGFRVGVGSAWGQFADATAARPALGHTMTNVEAEYAIWFTKLSGEWTESRFEAPGGDRLAHGWTAQVQQTITPRLFAHSRASSLRAPFATSSSATRTTTRAFRSIDTTVGYRVTPDLTLRLAYSTVQGFGRPAYDSQLGVSLMWAKRVW
jgi:hypothetical protein